MRSWVFFLVAVALTACGTSSTTDAGPDRSSDDAVTVVADAQDAGAVEASSDAGPEAGADVSDVQIAIDCGVGLNVCDGQCSDPHADINNCGGCGNVCPMGAHVTRPTCANPGVCGVSCDVDFEDCNGDVSDGCETQINTPAHCGNCATICGGSTPRCVNGACAP